MNLENGFARMSEEERWTLIEMMHKFRDDQKRERKTKEKSNTSPRYKPFFRK